MILVTGASGHTAHYLIVRLLAGGRRVRALVRPASAVQHLAGLDIELCRADLEDGAGLREACSGAEAVCALSHIRLAPAVLTACRAAGVPRVVFMSSARRYTRFPDKRARAVIAGEEAVRASALDYTIVRPTMIYGDDRDRNISRLVALVRRWRVLPLPGGGANLVQPIWVGDVACALEAALRPAAAGREYDLGGAQPQPYRVLIEEIAAALGTRIRLVPVPLSLAMPLAWAAERLGTCLGTQPPLTTGQLRRMREDRTVDWSAAAADLDFQPLDFAEGIRKKLALAGRQPGAPDTPGG